MRDLKDWKGCPPPAPVTLEGRTVRLEPYDRAKHLQALWDAFGGMGINPLLRYFAQADFGGIEDFDARSEAGIRSGWVREGLVDKASGKPAGMAPYLRPDPAVEIGGPAPGGGFPRSPLSTEAQYLLAQHVFEDLGYRRYEWKCHTGNEASKRTAARLGFTFEGVFRQHMLSKGENRDTAWFSIIDSEWPVVARAFDAWLLPENFDAEGRQKRRLEDIRAEIDRAGAA